MWNKVKQAIGGAAPRLGALLAGPLGAVVGGWVAELFGADPNDPDDVLAKLQADPEAEAKLFQLQTERLVEIARLEQADRDAAYRDRADARAAHVATTATTGKRSSHMERLSYLAVGAVVAMVIALFTVDVPQANRDLLMVSAGVLLGGWKEVYGFFFGGSVETSTTDTARTAKGT